MPDIIKSSPAAYYQKRLTPDWGVVNQTQVAMSFGTAELEQNNQQVLGITDVSLPKTLWR